MERAREKGEEPRAWSLTLIPFPFPFERLSPRLYTGKKIREGKGKEKRQDRGEGKEEKRKTVMVALLLFMIATLAEKTVGRKRSIWRGDNVLKNPFIHSFIHFCL